LGSVSLDGNRTAGRNHFMSCAASKPMEVRGVLLLCASVAGRLGFSEGLLLLDSGNSS
jgi:hypothetical protein